MTDVIADDSLVTGRRDVELLLLAAESVADLRNRVGWLLDTVAVPSFADLAGALAGEVGDQSVQPVRAAVVAGSPNEAHARLTTLLGQLDAGTEQVFSPSDGIFAGRSRTQPKIAYLFPGNGSGRGPIGAIRRGFPEAENAFLLADEPADGDRVPTEVAQGRVVAGSLAAVRVLRVLGIEAAIAVGHSLGEFSALAWAGAMGDAQLVRLARARGRIMATASDGGGGMAGVAAGAAATNRLIDGTGVVIAGYHGPRQTVISGPADAVARVCESATAEGVDVLRINVPHAFHTPLVRPAADAMAELLAGVEFAPIRRRVVSTVTGDVVEPRTDLRSLLCEQVLFPVRFDRAAATAVAGVDLTVEVGPGRMLAGLVGEIAPQTPVLSVDTDSESLSPLLSVVGAAYVAGARVDTGALFAGRLVREHGTFEDVGG
jgi:enediyne polyketide synthase